MLVALVCTGCAGQVARSATPPRAAPTSADPTMVLATVREREAEVRTLRARFAARVQQGRTDRRAQGVLLVKKPDRFRLRLLSPFGLTVFDYTAVAAQARMELPLEGQRYRDAEITAHAAFSPADLRPIFLRAEAAFPGTCTAEAAGTEVIVSCRDSGGAVLRRLEVDVGTRTVRRETDFASGQPQVVLQLSDYRRVQSVELPFGIALSYPQRDVQMQITVSGYEVNPDLPDALFETS